MYTSEEGSLFAAIGNHFEETVVKILRDVNNLKRWRDGTGSGGKFYASFKMMMDKFGVVSSTVTRIDATCDKTVIGFLPSGGQSKTDVLTSFYGADGDRLCYKTISCKMPSRDMITAHQYTADQFADVLDAKNSKLRSLLNLFQECGNARDMGLKKYDLEDALSPYMLKLCNWVVGGHGGFARDSQRQNADYLVTLVQWNNRFVVHTTDEYVKWLMAHRTRAFGSPFGWTYQATSGRGSNIQLKMPVKDYWG